MLNRIALIQGLAVKIEFTAPTGFFRLLDANARHILLNIRMSEPESSLFVNSQIDGVWGEALRIPLPPKSTPERLSVSFRLTNVLEVWNDLVLFHFEQFSVESGEAAYYSLAKNAVNLDDTLILSVPRPEEMTSLITTQVALRRLDGLERQLAKLSASNDRH